MGGEQSPPAQKKVLTYLLRAAKKKNEIYHISKNKNRTKKIIYAKNERQINSNKPCKYGHFWIKLNFWGAIWVRLGAQTRYDVIWNFTTIILLAHCTSFMSRWSLLREGGDPHIFVVRKHPEALSQVIKKREGNARSQPLHHWNQFNYGHNLVILKTE